MAKRDIIIDCDPGQDDAVALLLALACPDAFHIKAITAVAGNVPLALTQRNARLICDLAGRDDVPVHAGCPRPLVRELVTAPNVHGDTGIDGIDIREPRLPLAAAHGVDAIVDTLMAARDGSVTLVPIGPLTNIAMAMVKQPAILPKIERIVLMGGAMREGGNHSPSAEFNILVDPHAAHVVFGCGRPLTAIGLDVTHQALCRSDRVERIRALGSPVAEAVHRMLTFFNRFDSAKYGTDGAPLHDPCTLAWLMAPELFASKRCNVEIEIGSELTMGHTAVDFWEVSDRAKNVDWVHQVDADGFFDLLIDRLARYG